MQVIKNRELPTEGEWVMSHSRDRFVVVTNNTSDGLFPNEPRIAILAHIRAKLEDEEGKPSPEGKSRFEIGISGLRALNGDLPGANLDHDLDAIAYCESVQSKLTAALDLWAENTTLDERMAVWLDGLSPAEAAKVIMDIASS